MKPGSSEAPFKLFHTAFDGSTDMGEGWGGETRQRGRGGGGYGKPNLNGGVNNNNILPKLYISIIEMMCSIFFAVRRMAEMLSCSLLPVFGLAGFGRN